MAVDRFRAYCAMTMPFVSVLALLSTLLACSGAPTDDTAAAPSLTLLSPLDGAVVCGSPLQIATTIENFVLTLASEETAPEGSGHLHLFLNGQEVAQSDQETIEVPNVAPGEYQVRVALAYADHTALLPYVGVTVYITIDDAACEG